MQIFNKIEALLLDKKVKQKDLLSYIGITRNGYLKMKNQGDLKVSTLIKISEFFNISVDYFFNDNTSSSDNTERDIDIIFDALKAVVKEKIVKK